MMGIYLPNMEMPKQGFVEILIRDDGTVQQTGQSNRIDGTDYYTPYIGEMPVMYKAIPVPPHGRLIDADALISTIRPLCEEDKFAACTLETVKRLMVEHISSAPTIIEAEEGEYCSQKEHRPVLYPNTSPQRWERNEEQDEWKRPKE